MTTAAQKKYVYLFGKGISEGRADMKNLLGGKGANLAEMAILGLPVPAGFTITTECCVDYFNNGMKMPEQLKNDVPAALAEVEKLMGMKFGDPENPLLISCRSGARSSMPGMMETVLNVGLSSVTIPGLIRKTGNERFVYDAYRRLIMMYSDVVMEKAEGLEPAAGKGIRKLLDEKLEELKKAKGYASDTDLTVEDLKALCEEFKAIIKKELGTEFPDDAMAQLNGGIGAVFKSWNGKKAVAYRRIEGIPMTGEPLSTCSPWFSETWAIPPQQVLPSPVTLQQATTNSMANGSSMLRAKTLWLEPVLPTP